MGKMFKWEVRVLYLAPPALVLYSFARNVAQIVFALLAMGVLITDGAFTVVVTAAFLRPILETLRSGDTHRENFIDEGAAPRSDAVKLILRTKWMTLTGVAVAVASSSILYINFILSFTIRDTIAPNPWLNPVVFMVKTSELLLV